MHSNRDFRQSSLYPTEAADGALGSGSEPRSRRGRPRSGTQTRIASFRVSAEDFRILSANRRAVQVVLEAKLAELRLKEEEAIREKCAKEAAEDPYDWEADWSAASAADLSLESEAEVRASLSPEGLAALDVTMEHVKDGKTST